MKDKDQLLGEIRYAIRLTERTARLYRRIQINLLRAPCTYPRGKTAGYSGAENQKRRATLTSKTQTIMLPVARPRGITS